MRSLLDVALGREVGNVYSREELLQLTPQLQAEGRVEVSGSGSIRVMSDRCI